MDGVSLPEGVITELKHHHAECGETWSSQRPEHEQRSCGEREVAYHMITSRHNCLCPFLCHISLPVKVSKLSQKHPGLLQR